MCVTILIVAVVILPVTMLRSPQDFWVEARNAGHSGSGALSG